MQPCTPPPVLLPPLQISHRTRTHARTRARAHTHTRARARMLLILAAQASRKSTASRTAAHSSCPALPATAAAAAAGAGGRGGCLGGEQCRPRNPRNPRSAAQGQPCICRRPALCTLQFAATPHHIEAACKVPVPGKPVHVYAPGHTNQHQYARNKQTHACMHGGGRGGCAQVHRLAGELDRTQRGLAPAELHASQLVEQAHRQAGGRARGHVALRCERHAWRPAVGAFTGSLLPQKIQHGIQAGTRCTSRPRVHATPWLVLGLSPLAVCGLQEGGARPQAGAQR